MLQPRREFIFEEYGRHANANTAKRGAIQLQRHTHVIDCRRVIHQSELLTKARILYTLEIRAVGYSFSDEVGIGVKNRIALGVDDGSVVNHGPATHHRL